MQVRAAWVQIRSDVRLQLHKTEDLHDREGARMRRRSTRRGWRRQSSEPPTRGVAVVRSRVGG